MSLSPCSIFWNPLCCQGRTEPMQQAMASVLVDASLLRLLLCGPLGVGVMKGLEWVIVHGCCFWINWRNVQKDSLKVHFQYSRIPNSQFQYIQLDYTGRRFLNSEDPRPQVSCIPKVTTPWPAASTSKTLRQSRTLAELTALQASSSIRKSCEHRVCFLVYWFNMI